MKILHINTNDFGGAYNAAYRLYSSQREFGLNTNFLCLRNHFNRENINYFNSKIDYPLYRKLLWKLGFPYTMEHKQIKINKSFGKLVEKYSILETDYKIEESELFKQADIIHFHWINGFIDLTNFNSFKKKHIWTFHDMNPVLGGAHYENDQKLIENQNVTNELLIKEKKKDFFKRNKPVVVTPSFWLKEKILSSGIIDESYQVNVIPYGINLNKYNVHSEDHSLRHKLKLSNSKKIILIIAESIQNQRKGYHFIKEIIKQFSEQVHFLIVGANTLEISNDLNLGYIEDEEKLIDLYNLADLVLLPSLEDNLPNVMVESLSCGTPVLSFSNGGMKDHLKNGNGILVDEINYKSLAESLERFICGYYEFRKNDIRAYAQRTFNKRLQLNSYLDLYNEGTLSE